MTLHSTDGPTAAASDGSARGVRIRVHPGLCEGWGNCHRFGPTAVIELPPDDRA
jgi:hypothetical protein